MKSLTGTWIISSPASIFAEEEEEEEEELLSEEEEETIRPSPVSTKSAKSRYLWTFMPLECAQIANFFRDSLLESEATLRAGKDRSKEEQTIRYKKRRIFFLVVADDAIIMSVVSFLLYFKKKYCCCFPLYFSFKKTAGKISTYNIIVI